MFGLLINYPIPPRFPVILVKEARSFTQ